MVTKYSLIENYSKNQNYGAFKKLNFFRLGLNVFERQINRTYF